MAGLAGFEADVDFADDGVEEYEHEPGGGRFGISGGIDASMTGEFDVSQLPPPPNVPPPPIPDFRAEGDFGGGETEGVVEKKKKKKKHREEGDEESGERRHRKKKKKHREGDGEDGERPRRHRRHRRDPTEEGEAPSAQPVLSADLTVGGNFEGDLLPPANQDLSYSEDIPLHTSHEVPPIDISHEIPQDYLVEPTQYEYEPEIPPENNFEVNVPNTAPPQDPEISGDLGFSHTQGYPEESWNRRSPSIEYNSPRVIADPNVGLDDHPSVEDYYTRGNNQTVPSYGEPEQVVDVTVPVLEEDRPQVEATLEAPHVEPISVSGVMAPPEEVNLDVVGTPEPIAVNGNFNFSGNPELHGDVGMMPGEPLEQQTMYSFNDPTMGPPPDSSFGQPQQPKQKGGLSKLFGFRKSTGKGKKKNEPEMQVSGPIVTGPANQPGSIPYGQSTIIGSPDSTIRSGGVQQDPWQSNPQLFNPNIDTLDPQMGLRGTLDQQPQLGGRGGKPGKKLPSNRPIPTNRARVILLDGEEIELDVDKKGNGRELVDRICDQLSIVERDYFGLTFFNRKEQTWFWLDVDKKVSKQLKHEEWLFNFQVKFYPPEPALIQEELTRYQLTLQVRQDIFTGKLPCSWVTQALLGSFLVQSELGDYDPDEHVGIDYVRQLEFVRGQNDQLLAKIVELHKNHRGMSPAQADLKYLETAKRLEQYGYDLHPAWDTDDVDIFIGISFAGVVVYRGPLRISRFAWPKVLRISYRKNFFYLKIRSECYDDFEAIVGFKLANNKLAKRLWKISVEHHTFFRLKEPRFAPKANIVPRFGSRYRYSGRTQFQYRTMSIDRENPQFDRSLTKRRTASMPMLAGGVGGSQYGSMHSLNRPHPRALTMNKTQSVEYLPQTTQPRTPSMGHRTGSMEFGGSIGGSFQNIPAQSGGPRVGMGGGGMPMQARVGGGTPIQVRSDDRPPVQARFENGTPISQRPSITSQSPAQAPRIQYHQRSDQVSLNGSEYSARGVRAGGVPLPYANVNIPQGRVRVGGSSVGSAAEDDLL